MASNRTIANVLVLIPPPTFWAEVRLRLGVGDSYRSRLPDAFCGTCYEPGGASTPGLMATVGGDVPQPGYRSERVRRGAHRAARTEPVTTDGPPQGRQGLQVVDLGTPSQPTILGAYQTAKPANYVAVTGSLVLVVIANNEVLILRQLPERKAICKTFFSQRSRFTGCRLAARSVPQRRPRRWLAAIRGGPKNSPGKPIKSVALHAWHRPSYDGRFGSTSKRRF